MDHASEEFLKHIHPDLGKVARAASQSPVPWRIVYGIRTLEAEREAVRTGHSKTMHSRHLANHEGVACAFDVAHLGAGGKIDWAAGHEAVVFGAIAGQILTAAHSLGIHVEWGGTWNETTHVEPGHFHDWGHFQLPWRLYP